MGPARRSNGRFSMTSCPCVSAVGGDSQPERSCVSGGVAYSILDYCMECGCSSLRLVQVMTMAMWCAEKSWCNVYSCMHDSFYRNILDRSCLSLLRVCQLEGWTRKKEETCPQLVASVRNILKSMLSVRYILDLDIDTSIDIDIAKSVEFTQPRMLASPATLSLHN